MSTRDIAILTALALALSNRTPSPHGSPTGDARAPVRAGLKMAIQGERGLLTIPSDWMFRLRYNPFYDYLETRMMDWIDKANAKALQSGLFQ